MSEAVKVKLTLEMAQALNDVLASLTAKKRNEMRNHSHLMKALQTGCVNSRKSKSKNNDGSETEFTTKEWKQDGGEIEISRMPEAMDYLVDALNDKIDAGVPAQFSIGYTDLDDALAAWNDDYKKDKKEEAKPE